MTESGVFSLTGILYTARTNPVEVTYKLKKQIGYGGSANVFDIGNDQVLKVFKADFIKDSYYRDIIRELHLNKRLVQSGANVVQIKGIFVNEKTMTLGFLMERMPITCSVLDMRYFMSTLGLSEHECRLYVFRQICHAVATLHYDGFVHGDLKLANICFDKNGTVNFIDLSYADLVRDDWSRDSKMIPTELYGAADIEKIEVSPLKTECYSLGVALLTLFNIPGAVPYKKYNELFAKGKVSAEQMIRIVNECVAEASLPKYNIEAPYIEVVRGLCQIDHFKRMTSLEAARTVKVPITMKRKRSLEEERHAARYGAITLPRYNKFSDVDVVHYLNMICNKSGKVMKPAATQHEVFDVCLRLGFSF